MSSDLCDLVCSHTAITSSSLNSRQKKKASTYEPTCFPRCHPRCPFHIFRTVFVSEIYPGGEEKGFPFRLTFFSLFSVDIDVALESFFFSVNWHPWRILQIVDVSYETSTTTYCIFINCPSSLTSKDGGLSRKLWAEHAAGPWSNITTSINNQPSIRSFDGASVRPRRWLWESLPPPLSQQSRCSGPLWFLSARWSRVSDAWCCWWTWVTIGRSHLGWRGGRTGEKKTGK